MQPHLQVQIFTRVFTVTALERIRSLAGTLTSIPRDVNEQLDVQISTLACLGVGYAFALEAQLLPALTTSWNLQLDLSAWGRHGDRSTTDRFPHSNGKVKEKVLSLAFEVRMRADTNHKIQIPHWSSRSAGRSFVGQTNAGAFINTRRDLYG